MKKLLLALSLFSLSLASQSALAYSGYIGGGFTAGQYKFKAEYEDYNPFNSDPGNPTFNTIKEEFKTDSTGVVVKVGQYVAPNLAFEFHYVFGVTGDTVTFSHRVEDSTSLPGTVEEDKFKANVDMNFAWGLFAKPQGYVSESIKVYALLGAGGVDYDVKTNSPYGLDPIGDDIGLAYGLGMEVEVEYGVFLGLEYISYLDTDDAEYNGLGVTLSMFVW